MQLQNNTVLVTGGTSGFGFEFASKLIALGNTVVITGRNAQRLQEAKAKLPAVHTIQSDVSKREEIIALYERVSKEFRPSTSSSTTQGRCGKSVCTMSTIWATSRAKSKST